jgi:hypothetical protein
MTLALFSGAWIKMNHEKNRSKKSRDTVPLTDIFDTAGIQTVHSASRAGAFGQRRREGPGRGGVPRTGL